METLTKHLGPNASARDAAFQALSLAMALVIPALHQHQMIKRVTIYTTDPLVPAKCLVTDAANQAANTTDFTQAITNILNSYHHLQITIRWSPSGKGLKALRRAKVAAVEAARQACFDTDNPPGPPSKDQLRQNSRLEAIAQWQTVWVESPRLQPAYLALTSPPDGKFPPFIQGLAMHSRLVFSTGIRFLTTHAFTGEYSARFCPGSNDPHYCECGEPLQTIHHIIALCLRHTMARTRHLLPLSSTVSLSLIFGTKDGGEVLGAFIAASQACVRPRRTETEPEPEDYG